MGSYCPPRCSTPSPLTREPTPTPTPTPSPSPHLNLNPNPSFHPHQVLDDLSRLVPSLSRTERTDEQSLVAFGELWDPLAPPLTLTLTLT